LRHASQGAKPAVAADSTQELPLHLGPFAVRAGAGEAEAFGHETGAKGAPIPFTFPVRWLARPEIRAAAAGMIQEVAWVPIHESQSFDYRRRLETETDYRMRIDMRREAKPPRLILRAEITTQSGDLCLDMEMILRIVSMNTGSAAP
jgi:hypothetical protein